MISMEKLNDIVNSSLNMAEKILRTKIVWEVLRSLPKRFRPNIIAIEESKDLDTIKIEELLDPFKSMNSKYFNLKKTSL